MEKNSMCNSYVDLNDPNVLEKENNITDYLMNVNNKILKDKNLDIDDLKNILLIISNEINNPYHQDHMLNWSYIIIILNNFVKLEDEYNNYVQDKANLLSDSNLIKIINNLTFYKIPHII